MNIGLEHLRCKALEAKRKIPAARKPERVCQPVRLNCVIPLKIKHRLNEPRAGGIPVDDRGKVSPECFGNRRVSSNYFRIGLLDKVAQQRPRPESSSDTMDNCRFKRIVIKDGSKKEPGDVRLPANGLFGLRPQTRKQRVCSGKRNDFCRTFACSHMPASPNSSPAWSEEFKSCLDRSIPPHNDASAAN